MLWTSRAVILGSLLFAASETRAAVWAMNGAGCTPGDAAIQANRYTVSSGAVTPLTTQPSGPMPLYCPITTAPPACPSSYRLRLTYLDSDGSAGAVSVQARLLQLSQEDGRLTSVPGALVSSNSSTVTVPTSQTSPAFTYDFSPFDAYYYVRVDMLRASDSSLVSRFYGVALECTD